MTRRNGLKFQVCPAMKPIVVANKVLMKRDIVELFGMAIRSSYPKSRRANTRSRCLSRSRRWPFDGSPER